MSGQHARRSPISGNDIYVKPKDRKKMITVLPLNERRRSQLEWIIQAVDHFVSLIKNHTDADVSAACGVAYEHFMKGESGARAIYHGFDHARKIIKERNSQSNVLPFTRRVNP
jgi:hypothetical protein